MSTHHRKKTKPVAADRRQQDDRRLKDSGPPRGWRERRRSVERRLPEVEEGGFRLHEWYVHLADFLAGKKR